MKIIDKQYIWEVIKTRYYSKRNEKRYYVKNQYGTGAMIWEDNIEKYKMFIEK